MPMLGGRPAGDGTPGANLGAWFCAGPGAREGDLRSFMAHIYSVLLFDLMLSELSAGIVRTTLEV